MSVLYFGCTRHMMRVSLNIFYLVQLFVKKIHSASVIHQMKPSFFKHRQLRLTFQTLFEQWVTENIIIRIRRCITSALCYTTGTRYTTSQHIFSTKSTRDSTSKITERRTYNSLRKNNWKSNRKMLSFPKHRSLLFYLFVSDGEAV